jgi:hypothetical protein
MFSYSEEVPGLDGSFRGVEKIRDSSEGMKRRDEAGFYLIFLPSVSMVCSYPLRGLAPLL